MQIFNSLKGYWDIYVRYELGVFNPFSPFYEKLSDENGNYTYNILPWNDEQKPTEGFDFWQKSRSHRVHIGAKQHMSNYWGYLAASGEQMALAHPEKPAWPRYALSSNVINSGVTFWDVELRGGYNSAGNQFLVGISQDKAVVRKIRYIRISVSVKNFIKNRKLCEKLKLLSKIETFVKY